MRSGSTFARSDCPTTHCMTGGSPASVARRAHGRCRLVKTNARGAGGGNAAIHASAGCIRAASRRCWRRREHPSSSGPHTGPRIARELFSGLFRSHRTKRARRRRRRRGAAQNLAAGANFCVDHRRGPRRRARTSGTRRLREADTRRPGGHPCGFGRCALGHCRHLAPRRIAQQLLTTTSTAPRSAGDVTLVGAGPGDPELLTLKALRALQDADVILHDRLVAPEVLDLARRDAARICVGKAAGTAGTTQEEINALLVKLANQGKRVVRLKGGDPFVFGRGGEELQALAKAQINFSVVPGITAALGAAAYAGIPLTHRDFAHSVSFVAGQRQGQGPEPDWRALATPGATAV